MTPEQFAQVTHLLGGLRNELLVIAVCAIILMLRFTMFDSEPKR